VEGGGGFVFFPSTSFSRVFLLYSLIFSSFLRKEEGWKGRKGVKRYSFRINEIIEFYKMKNQKKHYFVILPKELKRPLLLPTIHPRD
jgi:hypothetical protein